MKNRKIAVIGLGYVGLPLAVAFGKVYETIGYDLSAEKIEKYLSNIDPMGQISCAEMKSATHLRFTSNAELISSADFIVVTVPTPVDEAHVPDFSALKAASKLIGEQMKSGVVVVYESTVYPGATEEVCIPILEKYSNKKWKKDFNVGYSPERVNPGEKIRTLEKVVKVISADNEKILAQLAKLYESIIEVGVYPVSSIRVAEASKVIENTQRDLNIALMNEFAIVCNKLGIDTKEVLDAAATKWNFLPFKPGLVGGHCIGVDPYYLTHKAETIGYHPQVILAGRRINDGMANYISQEVIKQIAQSGGYLKKANINILGFTFKEDCPDIRNSKVIDIYKELSSYGCNVCLHDPLVDPKDAYAEYSIDTCLWDQLEECDALLIAVPHKEYLKMGINQLTTKLKPGGVFVDIKSAFDPVEIIEGNYRVWRL